MKRLAALLLLAGGIAVFAIGEPDVDRMLAREFTRVDAIIASRDIHIDAAELLGLIHNRQVELYILDVRDEADYNLFHLVDAQHVPTGDIGIRWIEGLGAGAVKVIVDSDETRAEEVWQRAAAVGTQNVYILEGGIERWLELYRRRSGQGATFAAALGDRHDAAFPPADWLSGRDFVEKVKIIKPVAGPAGGCGG